MQQTRISSFLSPAKGRRHSDEPRRKRMKMARDAGDSEGDEKQEEPDVTQRIGPTSSGSDPQVDPSDQDSPCLAKEWTPASGLTFELSTSISFRHVTGLQLDLQYGKIFSKPVADRIFRLLEDSVEYEPVSQVKIFGKTYDVNRKVASFGDEGLTYSYAGVTSPANSWLPVVFELKKCVEHVSRKSFNFVLINRYKDGSQHIGEHRDDEADLDHRAPIASLSFGQARDFTFRHKDSRGKQKTGPEKMKLLLEHGSLLLMNPPTNLYWYHSLPKRSVSSAPGARVNLTFRKMRSR